MQFTTQKQQTKNKYEKIISEFQIQGDQVVFEYEKQKSKSDLLVKLSLLSDVFDFNTLFIPYLIPLIVKIELLDLLLTCKSELTRKLILSEFIDLCFMFNFVRVIYPERKIKNLNELRRFKNNAKKPNNDQLV